MDLRPLDASSASASMAPLCSVFRRYLKSRDLKYTPERADILDAIIERDGVFEPEELLFEMRRRQEKAAIGQPSASSPVLGKPGRGRSGSPSASSPVRGKPGRGRTGSPPGSRRVSKATIYRTIKLLQEAGIITQALFDSKQSHYRLIYGRAPRDYMTCLKTGRMIEFSDDALIALRARIAASHDVGGGGWEPVGHRFQIYAISPEGRRQIEQEEREEQAAGE